LGMFDCVFFGGGVIHIHIATLLVVILATPPQFLFGASFHVGARKAIARGTPNMDVLVSVATTISYTYAMVVLVSKACDAVFHPHLAVHGAEGANMDHKMHSGMTLALGCHALHFFGMAPILMAVVLGGKYMEAQAKIKTMESLLKLMECEVHTGHLLVPGSDAEKVIPVELVQLVTHCVSLKVAEFL